MVSVPAVCGGDITLTTDMLTTHVPLATDEPAYLFASPGRSSRRPDFFIPIKSMFFNFEM